MSLAEEAELLPCHQESTGEGEVASSTVKAARNRDTDALCAPTECAKMQ